LVVEVQLLVEPVQLGVLGVVEVQTPQRVLVLPVRVMQGPLTGTKVAVVVVQGVQVQ
jgi:hypothetical protein